MKLTIVQRLALARYLTDALALLRKNEMLPEAAAEMPSGSRIPVMFSGRQAGWVNMPAASKTASITDPGKLMAWAQEKHPGKIGSRPVITPSPALLEYIRDQFPSCITDEPVLNEYWLNDLKGALVKQGYWVSAEGEKITEVPGIEVAETPPVPRVTLSEDAASVIGAAWAAGDIPAEDLLVLPALPPGGAE